MKRWSSILPSLLCSSFALAGSAAPTHEGILFEVTKSRLLPATAVGDSVFKYKPEELICDSDEEETPCRATVDHWQTSCFKGDMANVCAAFESLFDVTRQQLLESGAEEDVELVSCSIDIGMPILTYNLVSGRGEPTVQLKDKMILMCPIFVQ